MPKLRGIARAIVDAAQELGLRTEGPAPGGRASHPRIYLHFPNGERRFIVYAKSTSDNARARKNMRALVRRMHREVTS